MANVQDYLKGWEFLVFGQIGEVLRIPDERTGAVSRYVRIMAIAKTYNFEVSTDEELLKYEKAVGQFVRATGRLGRRKNTVFGTARITGIMMQSDAGWKDPTEEELLGGLVFGGYCKCSYKRTGTYAGNPFQKVQLAVFGETFEIANVPDEIYENIPDAVMFFVKGHAEPRLASNSGGDRGADLILSLDSFRTDSSSASSLPPSRSRQPQPEAKSA
ncbi:MAG: hypothetical protein LBN39_06795 [Planctomycetaceae bacterium]|nr:hypothetical protein [Planctomycetaceae bacterium]